jgi:hypothetical protein
MTENSAFLGVIASRPHRRVSTGHGGVSTTFKSCQKLAVGAVLVAIVLSSDECLIRELGVLKQKGAANMAQLPKEDPASTQPRTSLRLVFRYDSDRYELVELQPIRVITPGPAAAAPRVGGDAGYWVELRDSGGKVLYHKDISRLIGAEAEVYDPDGHIEHLVGPPGHGQFEILVPDYPRARTVSVIASTLETSTRGARLQPAREVAKFNLRSDASPHPEEK